MTRNIPIIDMKTSVKQKWPYVVIKQCISHRLLDINLDILALVVTAFEDLDLLLDIVPTVKLVMLTGVIFNGFLKMS